MSIACTPDSSWALHEFPVSSQFALMKMGAIRYCRQRSPRKPALDDAAVILDCHFVLGVLRVEVWLLDVHSTGRYEVVIDYTCPDRDAGSLIELMPRRHPKTVALRFMPFNEQYRRAGRDFDESPESAHGAAEAAVVAG